jgi:hypothetical protein
MTKGTVVAVAIAGLIGLAIPADWAPSGTLRLIGLNRPGFSGGPIV